MSRSTYLALINAHFGGRIGAHADTIGVKADNPRYTICGFVEMANSNIQLFAITNTISKRSGINSSMNMSIEVV